MNVDEIFENINYDTGGYYSVSINEYKKQAIKLFNDLEADKLEMAKAIVKNCEKQSLNGLNYCSECSSFLYSHKETCIVNKASKYIKEVEK